MTIKEMRKAIGLNQADMAKALGVSRRLMQQWEAMSEPPGVVVEMLKLMLKCIDSLYEEEDIKQQVESFKQGNLAEQVGMFFF